MDDYLQYAPEITENFQILIDYSKSHLSAGTGKVYALTARASDSTGAVWPGQNGAFVRWVIIRNPACRKLILLTLI